MSAMRQLRNMPVSRSIPSIFRRRSCPRPAPPVAKRIPLSKTSFLTHSSDQLNLQQNCLPRLPAHELQRLISMLTKASAVSINRLPFFRRFRLRFGMRQFGAASLLLSRRALYPNIPFALSPFPDSSLLRSIGTRKTLDGRGSRHNFPVTSSIGSPFKTKSLDSHTVRCETSDDITTIDLTSNSQAKKYQMLSLVKVPQGSETKYIAWILFPFLFGVSHCCRWHFKFIFFILRRLSCVRPKIQALLP